MGKWEIWEMSRTAVVGGGAAGMMAACAAAEAGHQVTLFEHNGKLGKKIYITGKGAVQSDQCLPDGRAFPGFYPERKISLQRSISV